MSTQPATTGYPGAMAGILVQDPTNGALMVTDRCDRCGAQAYVRAQHGDWRHSLLFCAHHGGEHMPVLMEIEGIWVHDERDRLFDNVTAQKLAKDAV